MTGLPYTCSSPGSRVCRVTRRVDEASYGALVTGKPKPQDGNGPQPPRTLAIVLACVLGILVVMGIFSLINLLN